MNAPVSNLMDVDGDTNMDCMWGNHPIEQYIEKQIEDYRDGFRRYETPFERLSVRSSNSDELKFWAGSFVTNSRVPLIPPCIRDLPRDEYRAALMEKRDVISELKDLAREMYSLYKLVREPMLAELFGETAIRLRDEIGTIDREVRMLDRMNQGGYKKQGQQYQHQHQQQNQNQHQNQHSGQKDTKQQQQQQGQQQQQWNPRTGRYRQQRGNRGQNRSRGTFGRRNYDPSG
ncbi:hypothetical protein ACJ41O_010935 [Fusarium nematophilum]